MQDSASFLGVGVDIGAGIGGMRVGATVLESGSIDDLPCLSLLSIIYKHPQC